MTKFQHNDTVKCINNTNVPNLVVGMNYPVLTCDDNYIWLDSEGGLHPYCFSPDRFELTDEEVTFEPTIDNNPDYFDDDVEFPDDPDQQDLYQELAAAKRLLNLAAEKLEDCHSYELAEEINKFLGEE